ncbi:MAG TPA: type II toxin-antitoxin system RelE/ParE family toxin [Bacteroidales bacterium]|nr:type II toxin-antitoxin system RelE/ParE family toxin [Bacteroidales bacterium]
MVTSNKLLVVWDNQAKETLKKELKHIRKTSSQGAETIKQKIFEIIQNLPNNPFAFEEDTLKINNDGSYRRFFVFSYRIVYRVTENSIQILRIRHTSREPLQY